MYDRSFKKNVLIRNSFKQQMNWTNNLEYKLNP